jgi:hypothetical protein
MRFWYGQRSRRKPLHAGQENGEFQSFIRITKFQSFIRITKFPKFERLPENQNQTLQNSHLIFLIFPLEINTRSIPLVLFVFLIDS